MSGGSGVGQSADLLTTVMVLCDCRAPIQHFSNQRTLPQLLFVCTEGVALCVGARECVCVCERGDGSSVASHTQVRRSTDIQLTGSLCRSTPTIGLY